jgi:hypothetical protein
MNLIAAYGDMKKTELLAVLNKGLVFTVLKR